MPALILHGDDDQIVAIEASAMLSSKLVKSATLEVDKGAPHGMCATLTAGTADAGLVSVRTNRQHHANQSE